jgi:hypothetical protein
MVGKKKEKIKMEKWYEWRCIDVATKSCLLGVVVARTKKEAQFFANQQFSIPCFVLKGKLR